MQNLGNVHTCFAVEEPKRRAKSTEAWEVAASVLQVFGLAMAFRKVRGALGSSVLGARAVQQRDAWLEGDGVPATVRLRAVRRNRGAGRGEAACCTKRTRSVCETALHRTRGVRARGKRRRRRRGGG